MNTVIACNNDLTVVIATYHGESFLNDTIINALATNPAQLIISDDASNDNTKQIIKNFADCYTDKILYLHNSKNLGLTKNWNRAIALVETPYCLKLDHDDFVFPKYVSSAMTFLRSNPNIGIIAGKGVAAESGCKMKEIYESFLIDTDTDVLPGILTYSTDKACEFVLQWQPYACSSSTIYNMEAWHTVKGFDEKLTYCNDREIWFRIAEKFDIGFYDEIGAIQRIHTSNFTKFITKNDRVCFEYDYMFNKAYLNWKCSMLKPLFRKNLLIVGKAYLGSAWRSLPNKPAEAPYRAFKGIMTLAKALAL